MIFISELKKKHEGISFDETFDIKVKLIKRNPEIIDIKDLKASGSLVYKNGLFFLNYQLLYTLVLPSSRSMKEVHLKEDRFIEEIFVEEGNLTYNSDLVDEELVLLLTKDYIDLEESIIDNILLAIPLQVLAPDEEEKEDLPSGQDWVVMTEEQYQALKEENQKESNPFASLENLFDE
ncbi:YceD family protein [Streptococcus didelphis]|uniref:YceD family protein n=1 Tax=Streptococcus didelphis TaxID=102886 RepID=A0ABY9LIC4_9STRE|nr:YceD family protein [Streptococcus didelphis]WMB28578.1 YceD family protein [Streptococcus didelphis]WMB29251.1 YceD family protein [Streptococcus didelphis]